MQGQQLGWMEIILLCDKEYFMFDLRDLLLIYKIFSSCLDSPHSRLPKDHIYRMIKEKYSNIWPNQTIVSDQSELTILFCQPMIIYLGY